MACAKLSIPAVLKPTSTDQFGRVFYTTDASRDFPFPDLTEIQANSYRWLTEKGIAELIKEINPIEDATGKKLRLEVLSFEIEEPKNDPEICFQKGLNYESAIRVHVALTNLETGEIKEQDAYFGQIPVMTKDGAFIINGIRRVIVNQIVRSPGIFFAKNSEIPRAHDIKIIPKRGAWLEVEVDKRSAVWVKVDRKRKIPVTMFLRAFGYETNEDILKLFAKNLKGLEVNPIQVTLDKDDSVDSNTAAQGVYKRIRPGDLATAENAKSFIRGLFLDPQKYDLGPIARYKINKRFNLSVPNSPEGRVFRPADFIETINEMLRLMNTGENGADDIDHLSNRRIRGVGELVQNKFRIGLMRTERIIRDRMSVLEPETLTPTQLINSRPITAAMHEFFSSAQLSQFMDQTNPLAELEHKRRISAMGPGGLSRERASFEVRDVHPSHYGRICPVTTPEGANIGLVLHLASYARVNDMGFIETPYRKVAQTVKNNGKDAVGHVTAKDITQGSKKILAAQTEITAAAAEKMTKIKDLKEIPVTPYITSTVEYFEAEAERDMCIAQANSLLNEKGVLQESQVSARKGFIPGTYPAETITHIDISPKQVVSLSTSMIAFLEHDDNTRALMGSNMQRQAVPLVTPAAPMVGTGMESIVAQGQNIIAPEKGVIKSADAQEIVLVADSGKKYTFPVKVYMRTNQSTCFHQRPQVAAGDKVKAGEVLASGACVEKGEMALGQNLLVAYMSWGGYNYEDAVIISERVVKQGLFNSIHIEEYEIDIRDTKLGPEELTADIANVSSVRLKDLDEQGIVRIGATVLAGDILVGKVTPKGETELTAEDRLLRAIFGEKAREVKDSSLRLPRGSGGKVIHIEVLDRQNGDELATGVLKKVKVYVAQLRHLEVGDKMAGRHGNKGVISRIVPEEDMPHMADGTPVDIILNPLGVSSRMNIGQVLETHLGMVARQLKWRFGTPVLNGIKVDKIKEFLAANDLPEDGKFQLYDGRTGEPFDHKTVVGVSYMMKLIHLVEDKIHARSVGPYSLVTQQPLGGKAQNGGQRFGEMEVWALEAYGAAHALQEMLTIKSDDVHGRAEAYAALVRNDNPDIVSIPESFNVLIKELQSLCLKVELLNDNQEIDLKDLKESSETEAPQKQDSEEVLAQSSDAVTVAEAVPNEEPAAEATEEAEESPADSEEEDKKEEA